MKGEEEEMVEVGLGLCLFCLETVTAKVPIRTSYTFEKPLICPKCREGLLKLIRPDLKLKVKKGR